MHASDADQAEALLSRWGPEGQGKLGGQLSDSVSSCASCSRSPDPRWADPIKDQLRKLNQARAVNEVVGGFKPTISTISAVDKQLPPLRVVNGVSSTTSSTITTAAKENVQLSPPLSPVMPRTLAQPQLGNPRNSTLRWATGLPVHHENEDDNGPVHQGPETRLPVPPRPLPPRPINPSLATLEKAVAARIFFENLYFPLLRHTPSREQRRIALEKDMVNMQLNEQQKEAIRVRWRQNETDYLREQRRKVDVSAFVKLKTIGHGWSPIVVLFCPQTLMCTMCVAQVPLVLYLLFASALRVSFLR